MSEVIAFQPREAICGGWTPCPWDDAFSEYDRANLSLYAQLLHDEQEGASLRDLARDVFGLSTWLNSQRATEIVQSHLKRAHWVADNYFPMLGW